MDGAAVERGGRVDVAEVDCVPILRRQKVNELHPHELVEIGLLPFFGLRDVGVQAVPRRTNVGGCVLRQHRVPKVAAVAVRCRVGAARPPLRSRRDGQRGVLGRGAARRADSSHRLDLRALLKRHVPARVNRKHVAVFRTSGRVFAQLLALQVDVAHGFPVGFVLAVEVWVADVDADVVVVGGAVHVLAIESYAMAIVWHRDCAAVNSTAAYRITVFGITTRRHLRYDVVASVVENHPDIRRCCDVVRLARRHFQPVLRAYLSAIVDVSASCRVERSKFPGFVPCVSSASYDCDGAVWGMACCRNAAFDEHALDVFHDGRIVFAARWILVDVYPQPAIFASFEVAAYRSYRSMGERLPVGIAAGFGD